MILYHGSNLAIPKPDILHSRPYVDFGRGFYVTPLKEQAEQWCKRYKRQEKKLYCPYMLWMKGKWLKESFCLSIPILWIGWIL